MSRHDDPREPFIVTERDLQDGFEAVMDSLERLAPGEIDELGRQADAAEVGHDAYAIGLTQLESGDLDQAKYWLQKAVQYQVPGAQRTLEGLEIRGVVNATAHDIRHGNASSSPTATSAGATRSAAALGSSDDTSAAAAVAEDTTPSKSVGGVVLPASHDSLARGVTSSAPGTIFALTLAGGLMLGPGDGRRVFFGRDRNKVHVCLGEDDRRVSRHHGTLEFSGGRWRVRNMGHRPIRIDGQFLFCGEQPQSLGIGYTQIFVQTTSVRQHLLEVFVTGPGSEWPVTMHTDATEPPTQWQLTETERLVLVVFAQRYLLREPYPQPLSWRQAAEYLADLQPAVGWTAKRVEHVIHRVRARLSRAGVPGLTREEVSDPVGNTLNHNLIQELLMTTTLVPMDLALIDAA